MTARSTALRCAGRFTPISSTCPSRSTVSGSVTFPPRRPEAGRRLDCTGCQPAQRARVAPRRAAPVTRRTAGPTEPQGQRQTGIRVPSHAARSAFDPAAARIAADLIGYLGVTMPSMTATDLGDQCAPARPPIPSCRNEHVIGAHTYARRGILSGTLATLPTIIVQLSHHLIGNQIDSGRRDLGWPGLRARFRSTISGRFGPVMPSRAGSLVRVPRAATWRVDAAAVAGDGQPRQ